MKFALFCHSVISDWNNGHAHFLRGLMRALARLGHEVVSYEPEDAWAVQNLLAVAPSALDDFRATFPDLRCERYRPEAALGCWIDNAIEDADVVLVHNWNEPEIVRAVVGAARRRGVRRLFLDAHYQVVLDDEYRRQLGLEHFDAILAFSPSVARRYRDLGFSDVHVFHEAADTTVFAPRDLPKTQDVVWVGNYGDGDRSRELETYVFGPRLKLGHLSYAVYGVRYPDDVLRRLGNGLRTSYRGWLPNHRVPEVFSQSKVVLHVPRRQYVELLPGTPTIRVFEALACGACLVSLPWPDTDGLFEAGRDYVVAGTPSEMGDRIDWLCRDETARREIGRRGREVILARHTCGHRAEQLLEIVR